MAHTDLGTAVAQAIETLIDNDKVDLEIDEVYYGNHNNIPVAVAALVFPANKRRELVGVQGPGGRTDNSIYTIIQVLNAKVGDEATERLFVDKLAESVEALLHDDTTLGGIIIHGYVQEIENGITFKDGSMYRSVQLLHYARTRTML